MARPLMTVWEYFHYKYMNDHIALHRHLTIEELDDVSEVHIVLQNDVPI